MSKTLNIPSKIFFCIGAQKSATTTIHDIFMNHPDVCLPSPKKETKFFAKDKLFAKGINYYFDNFFKLNNKYSTIGEFDPEYLYFPKTAKRIYDYFPDAKIIVILRNPVNRAFSHYKMSLRRGHEDKTFREGLKLEEQRLEGEFDDKVRFSYATRGLYLKQLKKFYKYFDKKNIKIILFEDFINDQKYHINDICKFLEIDNIDFTFEYKVSNKAKMPKFFWLSKLLHTDNIVKKFFKFIFRESLIVKKFINFIKQKNYSDDNSKISKSDEEYLDRFYKQEIQSLSKFLKRNLDNWNIKK